MAIKPTLHSNACLGRDRQRRVRDVLWHMKESNREAVRETNHNRNYRQHTKSKKEAKKWIRTNKSPTSLSFPSIAYINVMVPLPLQNPIGNIKKVGQNEIWLQYKNNTSETQQLDETLPCVHSCTRVSGCVCFCKWERQSEFGVGMGAMGH